MAQKSRNLLSYMAHQIVEQWEIVKTARGNDFERESKRLQDCKTTCEGVALMAEQQIDILRNTGFISDDNILIDHDEVKLVNSKRNLAIESKKKGGLSLDEFVKK